MVKVEFIFTSLKSDKPVQGGGEMLVLRSR